MKYIAVTCENRNHLREFHARKADEVIFPLENHSFFAGREYSVSEITEMITEAHQTGMKATVLMNRLFHEDEVQDACRNMLEVIEKGADHIEFADPALFYFARSNGFADRMIYESSTLMTNAYDGSFWLEQEANNVIISSLLTKEEIVEIAKKMKNSGVVIHGHLLMSVSKRKLLSAFSEEYGLASLKDRTTVTLQELQRQEHMPAFENSQAMMIYSDYVQESFAEMPLFMEAGIERYEIHSPFLAEEALLDAVDVYRKILDGQDAENEIGEYRMKYSHLSLSDGYYGKKTVK